MTNVDLLFDKINTGREGKNIGLKTGIEKLDKYIGGIQRGVYTLIFGLSGASKTGLALYMIYRTLKDNPEKDIKYIYFSLEMAAELLLAKLMCLYMYEEFGIVISYTELMSWEEILSDEKYNYIQKSKVWLSEISEKLLIFDKALSAKSFYRTTMNLLEEWGSFTESADGRRKIYNKTNPEQYVIVVVDHVGLCVPETGNSKKQEIDLISQYAVNLRERCQVSFFMLQQENRNSANMDRRKMDMTECSSEDLKDLQKLIWIYVNFNYLCVHIHKSLIKIFKMVKINISKEELLEAINNGYDSEKLLTQHFNTSLSTIRRRLREANIKLFKYCFDTDSFFKLYQLGYNDTEIAKQLGVTHSTISDYRCNQGLPKNFKYRKELEKESIMSLYNEGKNIHEISKILNVDSRLVDLYINEKQITDDYVLSPTEEQIILGSLLGDGNITANKSNTKSHLVFAHSPKQKNYCIWKTQMLQNIMYFHYSFREVVETDKRSGKEYTSYRALSKDLPILDDFRKRWYVKVNNRNVKIINKDDLYKVNALGLAIWFMDDGYKDHNTGYMIATQCFSKDSLNTIKSYFKDVWDIDITIRTNGEIYIGSKYKDRFTSIVEPFIHSDCKYKLIKSSCKTPLNGETPEKDNPVLNPPEMEENAERLEVMLTE